MATFVTIIDQEKRERVLNVDEISELVPFKNDWKQGATVNLKGGGGYRVDAALADQLRRLLLGL